jgi:plasmid stabilization system protein ParE
MDRACGRAVDGAARFGRADLSRLRPGPRRWDTSKTTRLADQPRFGAEVPEYADETVREVFHHPFRILYRVEEQKVQVIAVIHAARQMPRRAPG